MTAADAVEADRWLLLRHASTSGPAGRFVGRSDRSIGTVDAGALSRLVAAIGQVDAIVLTPLRRTRQTLDLLTGAGLRVPAKLVVEPALAEQDFGRWDEAGYDELAAGDPDYWPFWQDPVERRPPGGESYRQVWVRSVSAQRRLGSSLPGRVLHIGHAGPIRALLGAASGETPAAALAREVAPLSLHGMQEC